MDLKKLFTDDRAVSPVIGTILLVSLTLLLVAALTTFIMSEGQDRYSEDPPQANFQFDFDNNPSDNSSLTLTHMGGGEFTTDNTGQQPPCEARSLQIRRDGEVIDCWGVNPPSASGPDGISGGDKFTVGQEPDKSVHPGPFPCDEDHPGCPGPPSTPEDLKPGQTIQLVWTAPGDGNAMVIGSVDL